MATAVVVVVVVLVLLLLVFVVVVVQWMLLWLWSWLWLLWLWLWLWLWLRLRLRLLLLLLLLLLPRAVHSFVEVPVADISPRRRPTIGATADEARCVGVGAGLNSPCVCWCRHLLVFGKAASGNHGLQAQASIGVVCGTGGAQTGVLFKLPALCNYVCRAR